MQMVTAARKFRRLLLGRKAMTNLDSILKNREITLLTKICLVKAMVFPVVMYGYESWTIKKAECWRIDVFKLFCWRRLLRFSCTARRSNQSILKEISPEYSLEGLMLTVKLQYFGHLMWKYDSLEKPLILGKTERRRRRGWQRMRWLDDITDLMDMSLSKLWVWWRTGKLGMLQSMESQIFGHDWVNKLHWREGNANPVLAWEIPRTGKPGGYNPWGCKNVGTILLTKQEQQLLTIVTICFMILYSHLKPLCFRSLELITKSV